MLDEYGPVAVWNATAAEDQRQAAATRRRAARVVAAHANNAADAVQLLTMLGLTAADGLDRTETTP